MWIFVKASAATPTLWNPSELGASLAHWYDASLLTGSNGDTVTSLSDQAGSLTLSGSGTLNTSSQNSLNTISISTAFTASSSAFSGVDEVMIASVFELTSSTVTHSVAYTTTSRLLSQNLSTSFRSLLTVPGSVNAIASSSGIGTTGMRLLVSRNEGGAPRTRVDGTQYSGNAVVAAAFDANNHTVTVGNNSKLCEIVFAVSSAFVTDDIEKTEGYLAHRWGLAGSLPAGHTYKNAAPTV